MKKAKFTAILLSLLAAAAICTSAYADGPGQPPYIEPTEEPIETEAVCTEEPTVNPYEELYQHQAEANEETNGLLADIKSLVSGLKSHNDTAGTEAPVTAAVPSAVQSAPTAKPTPEPTPEPTEVPKVTGTDGNGYIVEDTQQLDNGMEFFTMASKDGSTFYMVIDRNKDNEVYLLNKVDNADLEGFVEETASPEPTVSPSPSPSPTPTATPSVTETPNTETASNTKKSGKGGSVFIVILALAGGGAVYWFKFRRNGNGGSTGMVEELDRDEPEEEFDELNGNEINEDETEE